MIYSKGNRHAGDRLTSSLPPRNAQLRSSSYSTINEVNIPASSMHFAGKMQISYASSNTSGQLKKPLIVAEGFDAYGIMPDLPNTGIYDFLDSCNCKTFGTIDVNYSGFSLMNSIEASLYVIFDAAENVNFDSGFECKSGATFEIRHENK